VVCFSERGLKILLLQEMQALFLVVMLDMIKSSTYTLRTLGVNDVLPASKNYNNSVGLVELLMLSFI